MHFYCRICKCRVTVPCRTLSSLCKKCKEERDQYLKVMDANFPYLNSGIIDVTSKDEIRFHRLSIDLAERISHYEKINIPGKDTSILGKGACGEVFLIQEKTTKKKFALKVFKRANFKSMSKIKNLENEINVQRKISHTNIIKVYDVMMDEENIYIVMEYADGGNLFHYIRKRKKLEEMEAYKLFIQILTAVNFLHTNSFIHRDIKPENVLITNDGIVKLCDFGYCVFCKETEGRYYYEK